VAEDYRQYLKPHVVSKLANMELRARLVVEGFITGLHQSPYHGFSVEFAEHRQYMPGTRSGISIGNSTARPIATISSSTKKKPTSNPISFWTPAGPWGMHPRAALQAGIRLLRAAALSFMMIKQQDAVAWRSSTARSLRIFRRTRPRLISGNIDRAPAVATVGDDRGGEVAPPDCRAIKRRGLVIVISDLLDDPDQVIAALKHFRHKKNEVIVMQILDPMERSFAFGGEALFTDVETQEKLMTQPWQIQRSYQEAMRTFWRNTNGAAARTTWIMSCWTPARPSMSPWSNT